MTETRILAIAGQRQSGKTTLGKHIFGYTMSANNLIPCWKVVNSELIVPVEDEDSYKEQIYDPMEYNDLNIEKIWPLCRIYNFAQPLKEFISKVFNVSIKLLNGTDEDKNTILDITWSNLPKECFTIHKKENPESKNTDNITIRQLLQSFGTDICRKISTNCWVDALVNEIYTYPNKFAVITDCRFDNEVLGIKKIGGKVIKLTRSIGQPKHKSETALLEENFNQSNFDAIIDNSNMDEKTQQLVMFDILRQWGWITGPVNIT